MKKGFKHTEESKQKMIDNYKYHTNSGCFKKGHEVPQKCIDILKNLDKNGNKHPNWKGGKVIYLRKLSRKVAKENGFDIKGKVIHHIDGNITNNHFSNLQIMTRSEHSKFHYQKGDYPEFSWNRIEGGENLCQL
ncbi:MAG: HNH endonuclease [archaeon]